MRSQYPLRELVWQIINQSQSNYSQEVLQAKITEHEIAPRDRALLTEIVYGVKRHHLTLEHIIKKFSRRPPAQRKVLTCLEVGLYQLLFLDKVPAYAAINETVNILKKHFSAATARYGNALLRNIQRSASLKKQTHEAGNFLPLTQEQGWEFSSVIFPDPNKSLAQYQSLAYSYPLFLVKKYQSHLGKDFTRELLLAGNQRPPIWIRLRSSTQKAQQIVNELQQHQLVQRQEDNMLALSAAGNVEHLPGYQEGAWIVQGVVPYRACQCLAPQPGEHILDLCAAPGGKSVLLADLTEDKGHITACDLSASRLEKLKQNIARLRVTSIAIQEADGRKLPEKWHGVFDRVLLDAPCSNSGVLARRVEARWRINDKNITALSELQLQLLREAGRCVKQRGHLLYSTCSILPEENQQVVNEFIKDNPYFTVIEEQTIFPLAPYFDGGSFFKLVHHG